MPADRVEKKKLRQTTLTGRTASTTTSKKSKKEGPERVYTDAILTIKPQWADLIEKREKNHEFRKYELRSTVERIWLYTTAPISAITYVF